MKTQSQRANYDWYDTCTGQMGAWAKRLWRKRDRAAAKREARKER